MEWLREIVSSPSIWISVIAVLFGIIYFTIKERAELSISKDGIKVSGGNKENKKKRKQLATPSMIETILAIVNFISSNQQKEYLELKANSDIVLHQQLDYVDSCFSAEQFELFDFANDGKDLDTSSPSYLLSSMLFEKTYEGCRKSLIEMVKQNHLAELSDYTFQDKMEQKIKMSINYFKRHIDDFLIDLNETEVIERYSSAIRKIVKSSLTNARALSVEKRKKEEEIKEKYKKERMDFIIRYCLDLGYTEEDLQSFITKTF